MRLGTVRVGEDRLAAVEREGRWYALGVPAGTPLEAVLAAGAGEVARLAASATEQVEDAVPVAPLRPGKIVAIGLNYLDHIREAGMDKPERPLMFAKFPSSVIGPGDEIVIDDELTERVDWEVELAAVIGSPLRYASEREALAGVAGYTVANDVSARDLQFADGQWTRGKNLDTFCPLGPVVVTPDEIGDPQALALRTVVNGETVQNSTTAEMLFGVAELLSYCSRAFTLEPGDVVLTGTPWGCGEFMTPRRSLRPGDVVEVSVEGIGTLRNPVVGRR
ncbi:fumarylacetoacetate hydrolase family protein [Streptosporangium saharense]|uniref:5-carboxymethyl-2-hydroxymuconate isomerase n=1 Tax=Streptosporangium saharense TaxID=1706840 RepID=A0A7W7QVJ2_9ACTN|nr:fumarylacetoacetate hydrolase family protein [Streptosporangium saharense]MBB4920557.1 5-carboxymethyl-2-hydroxymuconate isomerase [Streptosporangium saharense]